MLPQARRNLIVETLGDETLIYDPMTHDAHSLNATAAAVWTRLDDQASVAGLATQLAVDEDVVLLALKQLKKAGLLEPTTALPADVASMSRRSLLKKVGTMAAALPLVASIRTPASAANFSCIERFGTCTVLTANQCCSKSCIGGQCA